MITAGMDGVLRIWDFGAIDSEETDDTSMAIDLTMKTKLRISPTTSIRSMHPLGADYLIVDANSGIWRVDLDHKVVNQVMRLPIVERAISLK
jgi:hypothetical protein